MGHICIPNLVVWPERYWSYRQCTSRDHVEPKTETSFPTFPGTGTRRTGVGILRRDIRFHKHIKYVQVRNMVHYSTLWWRSTARYRGPLSEL